MTNWTELKRLAEEATGGDWEFRLGLIRTKHDSDGYVPVAVAPNSPKSWRNQRDLNMQFIAAANPKTILALIAENERLSRFEEAYKEWIDKTEWVQDSAVAKDLGRHRADVMNERINQLRAEVEELKKESAWMPSGCDYDHGIHHNPDAKAWADLFVATFPRLADKHDLMLGWFANAMMAMYDFLAKRDRDESDALRKDAERYRHLKDQGHFRAMSIDMGGNHSWTGMGRHVGKGVTVDEAIDAEIARTRQ